MRGPRTPPRIPHTLHTEHAHTHWLSLLSYSATEGRYNLLGTITEVRIIQSQDRDPRLQLELEDNSGAVVFTAWDDACAAFKDKLKEGDTVKIFSAQVRPNPRQNGRPEGKLYADTRVERTTVPPLRRTYGTIDSIKMAETVRVRAVVADVAGERSQNDLMRCTLVDQTGETTAFLRSGVGDGIAKGDVVEVAGRATNDSTETVFVHSLTKGTDDQLTAFWADQTDFVPKRQKVDAPSTTFASLADIKNAAPATRGTVLAAVVKGVSMNPVAVKDDRVKRTITVADDNAGGKPVEIMVGVFHDKDQPFDGVEIGDIVTFQATVATFGGLSLNTNGVTKTTDAAMAAWWKTTGSALSDEDFEHLTNE